MNLVGLELKILAEKELPQVLELDQICLGGWWSLDAYRREINSPNSTLLIITISDQQGKKVIGIGCLWAILEEAHITLLAIHPDFQGQGLGKILLLSLLEDAVKRQLARATLEVKETNHIALSLYEKFGFKIAGRRKNYYQQTGEDALILWRGDLAKPEFSYELQFIRESCQNLSNFQPTNNHEMLSN
jgi:ribosomal-protein-alanine N-acetyltransferase